MFQPHSIRGLISRRNNSRINQDSSAELPNNKDPDLESVIEAKLIIKDIEHQIDDIRKWREHQKTILDSNLASNKAVMDIQTQSYVKNSQKDTERMYQENKAIMSKLEMAKYPQEKEEQQEQLRGDTNLFEYITNSNQFLEQVKHGTEMEGPNPFAEQNLLNEIEGLGEMVKIGENATTITTENKQSVDRTLLKQQFDEIDAELREVEELLKD